MSTAARTCALRYRLDVAGPVVYLVECDNRFHLYSRGTLGNLVSRDTLADLVSSQQGARWVPVAGTIAVGSNYVATIRERPADSMPDHFPNPPDAASGLAPEP
ncbi:MAG: hypothetical protein H0T49_09895 [Chloroflexia bacterium]|jgi:ribosomal protein S18 acetylase RimI-like enzyme|nr:hypothetical protein [Chloroflexia bacterium]